MYVCMYIYICIWIYKCIYIDIYIDIYIKSTTALYIYTARKNKKYIIHKQKQHQKTRAVLICRFKHTSAPLDNTSAPLDMKKNT